MFTCVGDNIHVKPTCSSSVCLILSCKLIKKRLGSGMLMKTGSIDFTIHSTPLKHEEKANQDMY